MLLFDENLSPKLPQRLQSTFEGCRHIFDFNLQNTDDAVVWKLAKEKNYTIISKDSDFLQMVLTHGYPPKFIWLRLGNVTTIQIYNVLTSIKEEIQTFIENEENGWMELLS